MPPPAGGECAWSEHANAGGAARLSARRRSDFIHPPKGPIRCVEGRSRLTRHGRVDDPSRMGRPGSLALEPLWSEAALALGQAERRVTARLARVLSEEDCNVVRWRTIVFLADGARHPMSALIDVALLPSPRLTRLVDDMVADNLVYRTADPRDRRRVLVGLTSRGRSLHRRLVARLEVEQEAIEAEIDADDLVQLTGILGDVIARLR
ncbi:MAG: MarR family transcriptional regulator [Solirubrobacteraceae bacterium]